MIKAVESDFGYHIIKLTGEENYPSFQEDRENLLKLYKQIRYNIDLTNFIDLLKEEFGFEINTGLVDFIGTISDSANIDSSYFSSRLQNTIGDSLICKFKNNEIKFDSLVSFSLNEREYLKKPINKDLILSAVNKLSEKALLALKVSLLENDDSDFANLMKDYKNGLYIFKIQEEEIWDNIHLDSAKVYEYYQQNLKNYYLPDRVDYSEILINDSTKAAAIYKVLLSGGNFEEIAENDNDRAALRPKKGRIGIVKADFNLFSKKAFELSKVGEISEPIPFPGGGWVIVKLNEKYPAGPKPFSECKAEVMNTFQELESKRLEEAYIAKLNDLYKPEKKYNELINAFNSEK